MPVRIQRRRVRGWKMPPNTVSVTRPGRYGNRYAIGEAPIHVDDRCWLVTDAAMAKRLYAEWIEWQFKFLPSWRDSIKRELGGKNLACWCPLNQPCHADVLLELANK
jgi:hypothetical protein